MNIKVGDRIRIVSLEDKYTRENYNGREGVVKFIDDMGTMFGTWGSLGVIPEIDEFEKI